MVLSSAHLLPIPMSFSSFNKAGSFRGFNQWGFVGTREFGFKGIVASTSVSGFGGSGMALL